MENFSRVIRSEATFAIAEKLATAIAREPVILAAVTGGLLVVAGASVGVAVVAFVMSRGFKSGHV